jgi:hypothetical protein
MHMSAHTHTCYMHAHTSIDEQDVLASCDSHPVHHCTPLPAVLDQFDDADVGVVGLREVGCTCGFEYLYVHMHV